MNNRRLLAALAVASLTVVACGGDDADPAATITETVTETASPSDASSPSEPTPTPTATSPSASPELTARPFEANTEPDLADGDGDPVTVTDVAVSAELGFDQVLLPVSDGGTPGWRAEYVDEARAQGSGESVTVEGSAVIELMVTNTGYPMDTGEEFRGDERTPGASVVREVVHTGVFEGQTQVFIGVDGEQPFRVRWDESARAVVVEIMTAEAAAL